VLRSMMNAVMLSGSVLLGASVAHAGDPLVTGDEHWRAGRLEAAEASFLAAAADDARDLEARMKLAGLRLSQQRYSDAIPVYQEAIGIDGGDDRAFIGLAISYLHLQNLALAEAALEEALRINPARREDLAPLVDSIRRRREAMASHPSGGP